MGYHMGDPREMPGEVGFAGFNARSGLPEASLYKDRSSAMASCFMPELVPIPVKPDHAMSAELFT